MMWSNAEEKKADWHFTQLLCLHMKEIIFGMVPTFSTMVKEHVVFSTIGISLFLWTFYDYCCFFTSMNYWTCCSHIYIFFQQLPYFQFILLSFTLSGLAVAADQNFKTFQTAYPYVVRKLLTDNSAATRRILHSVSIHFLWVPHYITYAF